MGAGGADAWSGNAEGSLQGDNTTIYAVGSEGYHSFVGGEGNTLVTDGEPEAVE